LKRIELMLIKLTWSDCAKCLREQLRFGRIPQSGHDARPAEECLDGPPG
jgi:hypothetical protein